MTSEAIKILCVKVGITLAELARRNGLSRQALVQKMQRGTYTPAQLDELAASVGCKYEGKFILPNGDEVLDNRFGNDEMRATNMQYLTDAAIERRIRYRLNRHNMRMHKIDGFNGPVYYFYTIGEDDSVPDDNEGRFFTLMQAAEYCEELEQKEAEWSEEQRARRGW